MAVHYQDHPFAEIWPLLSGEDFAKFVADIKANGMRVPVVLYQGRILDGRARYRACVEAGIEPRFQHTGTSNDIDALNLAVSLNDYRRQHSTFERRAFAAARLAHLKQQIQFQEKVKMPTGATRDPSLPGHNRFVKEAALIMEVSTGSLARARTIIQYAPELEKAVEDKRIRLQAASEKARPPKGPHAKRTAAKRSAAKESAAEEIYQRGLEFRRNIPKTNFLTPEEVDPDFEGTPLEFATKYGHVLTKTASQREQEAAQARGEDFVAWLRKCASGAPINISETDLLAYIKGNGTEPGYRLNKLTERWAAFDAMHVRLAGLVAQLESHLVGTSIEAKR
ncbi:hypothetical protein [Mesorhizobium sp. B1-1-8]|uniref:hypothetical protein n=1 Tax=Mesorhizobium sp. B1-1-8 TaxID=2589976 RepID=UPI00112A3F23|nr:hypothetical protein [Mesorhizobium sp. B1-1-8]UCI07200.1 hypothetical protein FJ974_25995 [Mesorhizobium sp. B1-1-8]